MEERERERGENRGKQLSQVLNGERDFRERQRNDTGEPLRMKRPIVRSFRTVIFIIHCIHDPCSLCGAVARRAVRCCFYWPHLGNGGEGREARKRRRRR